MHSFLEEVATELWHKYGEGISELKMVFPSRRAGVFFGEALSKLITKPLWQPEYLSIDDLIWELSSLKKVDNLQLITELYQIYSNYHKEPFNRFYGWGEMLLQDFDTIDKYLVEPDKLFANISDIRDIEQKFALDTPEVLLIKDFWSTFSEGRAQSNEQKEFLRIWVSLAPIYHRFNRRLASLGISYPGMAYRTVAENIQSFDSISEQKFCFVGFNALNKCEQKIFSHLDKNNQALFVWDYSKLYIDDDTQESGHFIRRNLKKFPDSLPIKRDFNKDLSVSVISSPTDTLQCKALTIELEKIYRKQGFIDKETAVVLTDETLLQPVLNSIPECISRINITMGYSITSTIVYNLLEKLLQLQIRKKEEAFYYKDVLGILNHPYVSENYTTAQDTAKIFVQEQRIYINQAELHEFDNLFLVTANREELHEYLLNILTKLSATEDAERREFTYSIISAILKLGATMKQCNIDLSINLYISLLKQSLDKIRIPYTGEPLGGLQIMGILETRAIDFKNIIMLSLNDDNFPGNKSGLSYIPYNLRQAYGLPTVTDTEAMYAYYFYRLLPRAKNITLMYTSAADDKSTGEQSRYIYQLEYEFPFKIEHSDISLSVSSPLIKEIEIVKSSEIIEQLKSKQYSPSAINRYINCPMQFYLRDVMRITAPETVDEEFSKLNLGNTLHRSMEILYRPLANNPNPQKKIQQITTTDIEEAIEKAIKEESLELNIEAGPQLIIGRRIIQKYIERILKYDIHRKEPFIIKSIEDKISKIRIGNACFFGAADRIDLLSDGTMAIIDYKTGQGDDLKFSDIESLFDSQLQRRNKAALQTLIYSLIYHKQYKSDISPQLYITRLMNSEEYSPKLVMNSNQLQKLDIKIISEVKERLGILVDEIFNPNIPFKQNRVGRNCEYCDYNLICNK